MLLMIFRLEKLATEEFDEGKSITQKASDWFKVIVLICFAVFLGVSIYGITKIKVGQDLRELAPSDSYLQPFYDAYESNFLVLGNPVRMHSSSLYINTQTK